MGNTEDVAEAHYVQELREFRKQASEQPTTATTLNPESVHYPDKKQPNPTRNPTRKGQEVGERGRILSLNHQCGPNKTPCVFRSQVGIRRVW